MNMREPQPQDKPLDLRIYGSSAELYSLSHDAINRLNDSNPDIYPKIDQAIIDLHQINPQSGPFFALSASGLRDMTLERAVNGVPTSKDEMREIHRRIHPGIIMETYMYLDETIFKIVEQNCEDTRSIENAEALAILANRSNASKRALELALPPDEHSENYQDVYTYIAALQECYFATLLSGSTSTYQKVHEFALNEYSRLKERSPEYPIIRQYANERQAELPQLAEVFGEDVHIYFSDYHRICTLLELISFTDPQRIGSKIAQYRQGMLDYATNIVLDADLTEKVEDAYDNPGVEQLDNTIDIFKPMELNWEFLPPGELTDNAREIVESANKHPDGKQPTIDLERLKVLENIRQWWGEDKCFYAKGVRKARRIIRDEQGNEQPDQYIVLVLRHYDESGNITHEDAIAESPIAGSNALYIQRYDANHWAWNELMKYPKKDVLSMGARSIKHDAPEGQNLVENMTEKVKKALSLPPEDFLTFEFSGTNKDGTVRIRLPKRVIDLAISDIG